MGPCRLREKLYEAEGPKWTCILCNIPLVHIGFVLLTQLAVIRSKRQKVSTD